MKLVVAYCQLNREMVDAVWNSCDELDTIEWADTSGSDVAYYELLTRIWAEGEGFVLLEQDKVPDQGALRELYDCPRAWCSYPHLTAGGGMAEFPTLGCTKFATELMEKYPQLMEIVGTRDAGYGPKHWGRLDISIGFELWRRSGAVHWHDPQRVIHKHQSVGVSL